MKPPVPEQAESKRYGTTKMHWFMVALQIQYVDYVVTKEGEAPVPVNRQKYMNIVVNSPGRNIVAKVLGDIRDMAFEQMASRYKIDPNKISDYIILTMAHMGHMSEKDHFTLYQPKKEANPLRPGVK